MLTDPIILSFVAIVNLIAIIMVVLSVRSEKAGRILFGGLFLFAGSFNLYLSFSNPDEFIYYAEFAFVDVYKNFFVTIYSDNSGPILFIISILQLLTAFGMEYQGKWVKYASYSATLFLLALVPLGFGAAFPSTLIMAYGTWRLSHKTFTKPVWKSI